MFIQLHLKEHQSRTLYFRSRQVGSVRVFVCTFRWCCCESDSDLCCFFSAPLSTSQRTNRSVYSSLYRKISLRVCFSTSAAPDGIRCVSQNQSKRRARVPDSRLLENSSGCARLIDDDDDCALSETKGKKWQKAKAVKTNLVSTESSLYKLNYIHVCLFWVCGHVKMFYPCSRGFPVCAVHVSFTVISPFIFLLSRLFWLVLLPASVSFICQSVL